MNRINTSPQPQTFLTRENYDDSQLFAHKYYILILHIIAQKKIKMKIKTIKNFFFYKS